MAQKHETESMSEFDRMIYWRKRALLAEDRQRELSEALRGLLSDVGGTIGTSKDHPLAVAAREALAKTEVR